MLLLVSCLPKQHLQVSTSHMEAKILFPTPSAKARPLAVLKTLKAGNFPGLFDVLGEESATHVDLMAVGQQFFAALHGQPTGTSMTQARYNLYIRKQGKPQRILLLPPTDTNLYLHVRRAHLQMLLWKAADQQGSPDVSIAEYGWKIDDGITCPSIDSGPPGPPLLINVISCRCRAKDKAHQVMNAATHLRRNGRWRRTMTSMAMTMMMIMQIGMSYKNNTQYWIDSMLLSMLVWFYYKC